MKIGSALSRIALLSVALSIGACGVAETASVAAAQAESAAEAAKQAKEVEAKVINDIDAAQKAAAAARDQAD